MICYKDMTFCLYHTDCLQGKDCPRALNDKEIDRAQEVGLPISVFTAEPQCFEPKVKRDE